MSDTKIFSKDKRFALEVIPDENPESPRKWDNLGTLVCFHKRYNLGDKTDLKSDDFGSWNEVQEHLIKNENAVICRPVYLYDHSGLRIKIGSFAGLLSQGHAEFDSGQVGFIYVSKEKLLKEYGAKKISKKLLAKANKCLEGEIETYDDYLSGNVYGFKLYEANKEKFEQLKLPGFPEEELSEDDYQEVDSCWGFFGYNPKENGIADHLPREAHFAF